LIWFNIPFGVNTTKPQANLKSTSNSLKHIIEKMAIISMKTQKIPPREFEWVRIKFDTILQVLQVFDSIGFEAK
jgi:hypothetical protein